MTDMTPVISSNLKSVGYAEEAKELRIEFHGGAVFAYDNVPKEIFDKLMEAESKGKFFHKEIRNGGYAFRKIK